MPKRIASLKKLPDEVKLVLLETKRIGSETLSEASDEIVAEMSEPGSPVTYPIKWDSDKQRKAFFATNGFGGGIPTVRTGKIPEGWKKVALPGGFNIVNNEKGAMFVNGLITSKSENLLVDGRLSVWQSKIHKGRWKVFPRVARRVLRKHIGRILRKLERLAAKKAK